ncbi:MAG: ferrous iron transport protein A, partial [Nitrospinota bacterium]
MVFYSGDIRGGSSMIVPLAELRQGQRGTLARLTCHPQEARRLAALGFAPGVWVARGRSAPFGDPV